jgi:hypothetical protein
LDSDTSSTKNLGSPTANLRAIGRIPRVPGFEFIEELDHVIGATLRVLVRVERFHHPAVSEVQPKFPVEQYEQATIVVTQIAVFVQPIKTLGDVFRIQV